MKVHRTHHNPATEPKLTHLPHQMHIPTQKINNYTTPHLCYTIIQSNFTPRYPTLPWMLFTPSQGNNKVHLDYKNTHLQNITVNGGGYVLYYKHC